MKKRLLALNLVLVLLLTLVPSVALADGAVDISSVGSGTITATADYSGDIEFVFTPEKDGYYIIDYEFPIAASQETLVIFGHKDGGEHVIDDSTSTYFDGYKRRICELSADTEYSVSFTGYKEGEHSVYIIYVEPEEPVVIDEAHFKDNHLRENVSQYDNNCDGQLDYMEMAQCKTIYCYGISSCDGIEHLKYAADIIISGDYTNFPVLPQYIRKLNYNSNSLKSVPDLSHYSYLRVLDCSNNQLTTLPTLPSGLRELVCRGNQIVEWPKLPDGLRKLNCYSNQLTSLPDLPDSLQELNCNRNQITEWPKLPDGLYVLNCSENQLTSLPTLPDGLQELGCGCNQIAELPELPNCLQKLECDNNQLTSLPNLPDGLQHLNCGNNQLTMLPTLPDSLAFLDFGYTQITELPKLPDGLKYLGCSGNQLTALPQLPDYLQELQCYSNQLTTLPDLPSNLQTLDCYGNQLITLPDLPDGLQRLSCSNNQLTALPTLPDSMEWLSCSNNQLTSLPDLPSSMGALNCSNNNLMSIRLNPEADGYGRLDVSNNCLPGKEAVTGYDIVWEEVNFIFGEQRVAEVHTHTTETVNYVAPTCTEDGYTGDEVCTACGETVSTGETIPAAGHSYGDDNVCDDCGHKQSVTETIQTWISDTIQSIRNFFDKIFGRI